MSIELPPLKLPALPSLPSRSFADHERYIIELREVMRCRERLLEARERILLARVAEADEQRGQWAGLCVRLEARVSELEAVLAKFDERWLMDGELGFCVACGVSIEGGESHKPDCWLTEANAARGAK